MEITGSRAIEASRASTWAVLADVDGLVTCAPSLGPIQRIDDRHARLRIPVGSGFLATTVTVALELGEVRPQEHAAVAARGEASGTRVDGTAQLDLEGPAEGPTTLRWTAEVQVTGALAGFASQLIQKETGRLLDEAIDCVRSRAVAAAARPER